MPYLSEKLPLMEKYASQGDEHLYSSNSCFDVFRCWNINQVKSILQPKKGVPAINDARDLPDIPYTSKVWTELTPKVKLYRLRKLMAKHKIGVYIIPSEDEHHSERTMQADKRVEFISGFTGGTGICVVTLDKEESLEGKAVLSTDGRFFLQADDELDPDYWKLLKQKTQGYPSWQEYVIQESANNSFSKVISCDPKLISASIGKSLEKLGSFKPLKHNLVDIVWAPERPKYPLNEVYELDIKYSGEFSDSKLDKIREMLITTNNDYLIVSALDDISWLLNLRCDGDFEFAPFFKCYALVTVDKLILYMDESKILSKDMEFFLIKPYDNFFGDMKKLDFSARIIVSEYSSYALIKSLKSNNITYKSVISYLKIYKNKTELFNAKIAQHKDSLAFIILLSWLEDQLLNKKSIVNEYEAVKKIYSVRSRFPNFKGHANAAISSSGRNTSVIHYAPTKEINWLINPDDIYLLDSGAQYLEGTTDITRTYKFGYKNITLEDTKYYTLVLKGHLAVSMAKFPGTSQTGTLLDGFSRQPLWDLGLDFNHGSGHGIGSFGQIHEGPLFILTTSAGPNKEDLFRPGGLLTIEPGYYIDGIKGYRIESEIEIIETELKSRTGDFLLGFNYLTKVPFCRKLIDTRYLTINEIEWINEYYKAIRDECGPSLLNMDEEVAYNWLMKETEPL